MKRSLADEPVRVLLDGFAVGPAGAGSAVALMAATAAALLERCATAACRDGDAARARKLREALTTLIDDDAAALAEIVRARATPQWLCHSDALVAGCEPPRRVGEVARELSRLAEGISSVRTAWHGEVQCARVLADTAATLADAIIAQNVSAAERSSR